MSSVKVKCAFCKVHVFVFSSKHLKHLIFKVHVTLSWFNEMMCFNCRIQSVYLPRELWSGRSCHHLLWRTKPKSGRGIREDWKGTSYVPIRFSDGYICLWTYRSTIDIKFVLSGEASSHVVYMCMGFLFSVSTRSDNLP